jgi:NADH:ubiquinone oxidoreductase subunit C
MTIDQHIIEVIKHFIPGSVKEVRHLPLDETILTISADNLHKVVTLLANEFHFTHLSTITGIHSETGFELLYHFWHRSGLTLRVELSQNTAQMVSLVGIIPGAELYEREITDMFGIEFTGRDHVRLLLPDNWEDDPPML